MSAQASVLIFAANISRLRDFYSQVLGLTPADGSSEFVRLCVDAQAVVELHALPREIAETIEITDPPQTRSDAAIKPCFAVPRVDQATENCRRLKGQVDEPWSSGGQTYCDCRDPEGNVFQLRTL